MAALGAQARMTARGERNPHVGFDDPLESRAWAVWFSVRNGKVRASKAKPTVGPAGIQNAPDVTSVVGYRVEVNLTTKMRDLWKEFGSLPKVEQNSFANEIRSFLRASGNMICVRQPGLGGGDHGQPEWWVREVWNDVKGVPIFKQTELTARERRLTPAEAGEDRPPAPVTVSNGKPKQTPAPTKSSVQEQVASDQAKVAKVIAAAEHPLYQTEIAELTGFTHEKTGRLLRGMLKPGDKRVFRRLETREERKPGVNGRFHLLYWHSPEIPHRDRELYRMTGAFIDRVLALRDDQSILTRIMSSGIRAEVQTLIDSGLLELINVGTEDERVRLAKTAKPEQPQTLTGVVQPSPEVTQYTGMEAIGAAISQIIDDEVKRRTEVLRRDLAQLDHQLDTERQKRTAAEQNLIHARTELSQVKRERDAVYEKWDAVRKLLGNN